MIDIKDTDTIEISWVIIPEETVIGIMDQATMQIVVNGNRKYHLIEHLEGSTGLFMDMETGDIEEINIGI